MFHKQANYFGVQSRHQQDFLENIRNIESQDTCPCGRFDPSVLNIEFLPTWWSQFFRIGFFPPVYANCFMS